MLSLLAVLAVGLFVAYRRGALDGVLRGVAPSSRGDATVAAPPPPRRDIAQPGTDWTVPSPAIELRWVAPGGFTMGTPASDEFAWPTGEPLCEGPNTRVTLTRGYWLGKYEVTRDQYAAVMGDCPPGFDPKKKEEPGKHPVVNVSWNRAVEFCEKLTAAERAAGRLPAGWKYALPTEAQWEYAARAGTSGRHPGGDDIAGLKRFAWYSGTSGPFSRDEFPKTRPVGLKEPNAWGFYDMLGNAAEWCLDWAKPYPGGDVTDPRPPEAPLKYRNGEIRLKVRRGGSWLDTYARLRHSDRKWSAPEFGEPDGFREGTVGFRLACVSEEPVAPAVAPLAAR